MRLHVKKKRIELLKGIIFIPLLLLCCLQVNGQDSLQIAGDSIEKIVEPVNIQVENLPDNLHVKETINRRPGVPFFVLGGIAIAGGITGTLLSISGPKVKVRDGNIVKWKETNLIYASAGVVIGGFCIGSGIRLNKKAGVHSNSCGDSYIPLPPSKGELSLNIVAYGNELGFRLTF